jgi:hypothetical protein
MADILKFAIPGTSFDPDTASLLGRVFDDALSCLEGDGLQPDIVKEVVASRIITLASKGERNPSRLRRAALSAFGLASGIDKVGLAK